MSVQGLDALNKRLAAMPGEARTEIRKALDEGADRIVSLARGLAPVDDGDLRGSIKKRKGRHELAVEVIAGGAATTRPVRSGVTQPQYDYAAKIEAETGFFFGSYRALRKSIRAKVSRAITKSAKRAEK